LAPWAGMWYPFGVFGDINLKWRNPMIRFHGFRLAFRSGQQAGKEDV